ncbi:unannotated protein [freshwater metagenome]|uniref:Unannotated protein n=1 Tax=freshwater metagenome TaxID=449393 RepID=A0A6J7IT38_9ZZZZ
MLEELAQFAQLRVGQRVHGIHDDRLDARQALAAVLRRLPKHGINDRNNVGKGLARTRTCGEHVRLAGLSSPDGIRLMPVQDHAIASEGFGISLESEDSLVLRMENACFDEFTDGAARFEVRIETQPWLRPLNASFELTLDELLDPFVAHLNERRGECAVVRDHPTVNIEYVHAIPQPLGQPKATGNSVDAGMHVAACGSTFADCRRVPPGGSQCDGVMRIRLKSPPVSNAG